MEYFPVIKGIYFSPNSIKYDLRERHLMVLLFISDEKTNLSLLITPFPEQPDLHIRQTTLKVLLK
ncbi:hypothetical protein T4B_12644 [Trichinella pseudospiralis]|uniref:Uncharacterized protein n=1 Tax=Trichinella pseudospiralis TaxID=6337 RepID=A0A0V1J379_TRIPS|nr:hypothetical protein T4B_12644 [Trichinella pseudospiralis]